MAQLMIYGAYGYTGELVARLAVKRGLRPLLAGRGPERLEVLADELGCEIRAFQLQDPSIVERRLEEVDAVLNCAGPFSRTFRTMTEACLATGTHYLDITGEIDVFESLARRDESAREAEVMLMPGVGFDVVPTDCLALHLKERLPEAVRLTLGIQGLSRVSRGTATTMVENLHRGGKVRQAGRLVDVPPAWKSRSIDFGKGRVTAVTVPWGDVSTAFHSTGIPDIEVYLAVPALQRPFLQATRYLGPLLASTPVQAFLKGRVRSGKAGPSERDRQRGWSRVWGEVESADGRRATSRLRTPEGYSLTADAAVTIAGRVLEGEAPVGFQTPAKAYGADLVLELEGVEGWEDL